MGEELKPLIVAVDDFINGPRPYPYPEPMEVRDYRHALYQVWEPLCRAITAWNTRANDGERHHEH